MPDEQSASVAANIRRFRSERQMTPSQLADKAGVSKSYIFALENETERKPSAVILYEIASALGVAMSDLLGRPILVAPRTERPQSLLDFAAQYELPETDIEMLASISFRGEPPQTVDRWQYIYNAIRMSEGMDKPGNK
jgi:transcriptional regulator with XRE-family HTH domain